MSRPPPPAARAAARAAALALALASGAAGLAPDPARAQASGSAEELTGLPPGSVVALHMGGDRTFTLYFIADRVGMMQRAPVPARLCAAIGTRPAGAETLRMEEPNPVPGMMRMEVRCR